MTGLQDKTGKAESGSLTTRMYISTCRKQLWASCDVVRHFAGWCGARVGRSASASAPRLLSCRPAARHTLRPGPSVAVPLHAYTDRRHKTVSTLHCLQT